MMSDVLAGLPLAAPTPTDDSLPGLGSFLVFAFLAVALYFMLKNMNARLRRMSYREREREAAARESLEQQQQATGQRQASEPEPRDPEAPGDAEGLRG